MRCETCQGAGKLPMQAPYEMMFNRVCNDCMGSGIAHCCDGLRNQPDPHEPDCKNRPINIHGEESDNDHGC